jgi:hypothetical protein
MFEGELYSEFDNETSHFGVNNMVLTQLLIVAILIGTTSQNY